MSIYGQSLNHDFLYNRLYLRLNFLKNNLQKLILLKKKMGFVLSDYHRKKSYTKILNFKLYYSYKER